MADAIYSNTLEGGTDGATFVASGSGGGANTAFFSSTGGAITYTNTFAAQGTLSCRLTITGGSATYLRADDPAPSGRGGMRRAFYYQGTPAQDQYLVQVRSALDANLASVAISSTGAIKTLAISASLGTSSTGLLTSGTWYYVELFVTAGASTTTGTVEVRVEDTAGTVIYTNTYTNVNIGSTDPPARFRFGAMSNATAWTYDYVDSARWGHVASGWFGPIVNQLPTATITGNQNVAAAATVTASVTATDTDGTIASYAWTVVSAASTSTPSLTGASTATVTLTAPAAGNVVTLQCVITDNSGGTVTKTTEVRVPSSGAVSVIGVAPTGASGWTIFGGAGSEAAALNDANATTGVESPDITSTASERLYRLGPMTPRAGLTLPVPGVQQTAAGTLACRFRVYSGGVLLTDRALPTTTTATDTSFSLTSGEVTALSDWCDVRAGLVAVS